MQLELVDGFWPQYFTFDPENGDRALILDIISQMQSLASTLSLLEVRPDNSFIIFPIKNKKQIQFILQPDKVIAMIYDYYDPD